MQPNQFYNLYAKIKKEIESKKLKRKREEKENLILNPQKFFIYN